MICPCCLHKTMSLYHHHWFEPPDYSMHVQHICKQCNCQLRPDTIWSYLLTRPNDKQRFWMSHILPSWELQCLFVKHHYNLKDNRLFRKAMKQAYKLPFPSTPLKVRQSVYEQYKIESINPILAQPRNIQGRFIRAGESSTTPIVGNAP